MYRLLFVAIAALTLSACSHSKSSPVVATPPANTPPAPPAPAAFANDKDEGGFYPVDSALVPAAVQQTAPSVYLILVPQRFGHAEMGGLRVRMEGLTSRWSKSIVQTAYSKLLDACKRQIGLLSWTQTCDVPREFEMGTAFLTGDGRTLWTAAHVVRGGIGTETAGANRPFFVFDRDGKLIFDSTVEHAESSIEANDPLFATLMTSGSADYAKLDLPRAIGTPLRVASQLPSVSERVYAIGYPSCTGCTEPKSNGSDYRDRGGALNAPGLTLRVSQGKMADAAYAAKFPAVKLSQGEFATSVDAVGGNSGGPILNSAGEVVGIVTEGEAAVTNQAPFLNRIMVGVNPAEMQPAQATK